MTQNNSVATTNTQVAKAEPLHALLDMEKTRKRFDDVLKENAGAFVASIIELHSSDVALKQCNPKDVIMEALKAATLKLPINKSLGFAYLIAYNENKKLANGQWTKQMTPTFQLGYKGLIQLAMRTGHYKALNADAVYEGELKSTEKLSGLIDLSGEKTSDKIVGYFAHFELVNGFTKTIYSTKEQVTAHAERFSKAYKSEKSPWKTDFDAMATKTVIRALLSKWGILTIEMAQGIANDIDGDHKDEHQQDLEQNANTETVDFDEVSEPEPQEAEPGF